MEITKEIIEKSVLLNEGTTCYIMQYNNSITYLFRLKIEFWSSVYFFAKTPINKAKNNVAIKMQP